MKKFICITAFLKKKKALGLFMTAVMAGVVNMSVVTSAEACTPYRQYVNAPLTINLNPTLAIGSVVATANLTFPAMQVTSDCPIPYGASWATWNLFGEGVPDGRLYPTTIPGVAYRGAITAGWADALQRPWPLITGYPVGTQGLAGGTATLTFIKTGPIEPGTFGPQMVMHGTVNDIPFFELYLGNPIPVVPTVPACTVTQSAITVNLEDTSTSQLAAMGNTSKDKAFNIPLTCNSATNIALAFSGDIADDANAVFRNLSGDANAASVGVQILKDNTPVPTTSGNFLNLGTINGSITVPMTARYYALTDNVEVGAVKSIAYATIVYN
ncbi:TPA: fimbrial protein [Serratia fonticola]|nr:fimbrial protein [Serratia fonticola]